MFWKCVLCGDQAVLILSHTVKLSAGKGKLKTTPQYAQDFNMKNSSCFFLLWLPSWQIFCSEGLPPGLMPTKVRTVGFSMWLSEEIPLSTDKKSRFYLFFFFPSQKSDDKARSSHSGARRWLSWRSPHCWLQMVSRAPAPAPRWGCSQRFPSLLLRHIRSTFLRNLHLYVP